MNDEILNKLKELQKSIKDYAKYLEEHTYHPYDTVEDFARELNNIITEIESHD